MLDPEKAVRRITEYARVTKIRMKTVNRLSQWQKFGLPDLRGFVPHLRTVNVENRSRSALHLARNHLWIIHDILHIIFYDYVTLNLGQKSWNDPSRFIESHLASEAFAVLLLDYHILPQTELGGLAVDFQPKDWSQFQKINPILPEFNSKAFCHELTALYLTDSRKNLNPPRILAKDNLKIRPKVQHKLQSKINFKVQSKVQPKVRSKVHFKDQIKVQPKLQSKDQFKVGFKIQTKSQTKTLLDTKYQAWVGHEERYSRKQRYYVLAWLEDLCLKKNSKKEAVLEKTFVSEAIWDLIHMLTRSDSTQWELFLQEMSRHQKPRTNLFKDFPKYRAKAKCFDYRFTDIYSQSSKTLSQALEAAKTPEASALFLFWQILSTFPPTLFEPEDLKNIRLLALSSQTKVVKAEAWNNVRSLCLDLLPKLKWKADRHVLSTFFLP